MSRLLKKSNTITLDSKSLKNIFYCLKTGGSFEDVKNNFLFEINLDEKALLLKIRIPEHQKYVRFQTEYNEFKDLFNYMKGNQKDPLIIPFLGKDLLK
jgi:hypothetical protein